MEITGKIIAVLPERGGVSQTYRFGVESAGVCVGNPRTISQKDVF